MKLIVCGKGGSGKSTVTALLARDLAEAGKRVVVLDTDVSNGGLHRLLGTEPAPDLAGYFGGPVKMSLRLRELRLETGSEEKAELCKWTVDTIPADYSPMQDGVRMVNIAKLWDASHGCTCSISALARQFLLGLDLGEDDRLLIDTEAGIEHFGRGLDQLCDAILMVIDPSFESICLTRKVLGMAESISIPVFFVLNRTDAETRESLIQAVDEVLGEEHSLLGEFPIDPELMKAGLVGRPVPFGYAPAREFLKALEARIART